MPRFRLSHSRANVRGQKNPPPSKVSLFYYRPKVPIDEMEVIALDWLDDLINRYDGKISNWDVFNEVLHGNFFRRNFGKDFWNKIIRRIRNINPNVDLAFNDYEILSSNFAKCYITYLDDVEIDFFGLQAGPKNILHASA